MSLFKRNRWYWMDDVVNGIRYRLPLKTTNWQEAKRLEKEKLNEIAEGKAGSHGQSARQLVRTPSLSGCLAIEWLRAMARCTASGAGWR